MDAELGHVLYVRFPPGLIKRYGARCDVLAPSTVAWEIVRVTAKLRMSRDHLRNGSDVLGISTILTRSFVSPPSLRVIQPKFHDPLRSERTGINQAKRIIPMKAPSVRCETRRKRLQWSKHGSFHARFQTT